MIKTSDGKYKVSVILTVMNREKTILRALKSLAAQSFKNYEAIIIDDGSTDKSAEIILKFIRKYDNYIYLYHSNRGFPLSLNTGIKISAGDYITSLDSDDEYSENHLLNRINFFKKYKNIDLIHSPAELIGKEKDMYVPDARNKSKLIHLNECIIGATIFGKKEVFEKLNGYKNIYGQDFDFINRAKKVFNVSKFNDATYKYYRNSGDSIISKLKRTLKHN
ncbi:glycosyltransferase family A protein [soil metagenome]